MSLLIRALKQAERDNREAVDDEAGSAQLSVAADDLAQVEQPEVTTGKAKEPSRPEVAMEPLHTDVNLDNKVEPEDAAIQGPPDFEHDVDQSSVAGRGSDYDAPVPMPEPAPAPPVPLPEIAPESAPNPESAREPMALARESHAEPAPVKEIRNSELPASARPPSIARAAPIEAKEESRFPVLWSVLAFAMVVTGAWLYYEFQGSSLQRSAVLQQPLAPANVAPELLTPETTSQIEPAASSQPSGPSLAAVAGQVNPAVNTSALVEGSVSTSSSPTNPVTPAMTAESTAKTPVVSTVASAPSGQSGASSDATLAEVASKSPKVAHPDTPKPESGVASVAGSESSAPGAAKPPVQATATARPLEPINKARAPARRSLAKGAKARSDTGGIQFRRVAPAKINKRDLLTNGYEALVRGDSAMAGLAYRQALDLDRNLPDAWIGLATIAARLGDTAKAEQHYRQALRIDPNDSVALTGLATLVRDVDEVTHESRLRNLASAADNGAAVQFALGNSLAGQGRWGEAQQAYFRANSADPAQPDYAFNLAVALEHIRQPRAALDYYNKAIDATANRPAQFSLSQAQARIAAISRSLPGGPATKKSATSVEVK